jgi:hypothetical protein
MNLRDTNNLLTSLTLILCLNLFACTIASKKPLNAKAFWKDHCCFNIDSIGEGKTLVFQLTDDSTEKTFTDYQVEKTATDTVIIMQHYDLESGKFDSSRWSKDYETDDSYGFWDLDTNNKFPIPVKTDMTEILVDGTKTGRRSYRTTSFGSTITTSYVVEEKYLKDTIFVWRGQTLPCVVTSSTTIEKIKNKDVTIPEKESTTLSTDYYVKGMGVVRFTYQKGDDKIDMVLSDIIPIKR